MNAKFMIENVHVDGPHAYVRASLVMGSYFAVSSGSELGGVRLHSELHEPNPGTFLFRLESASDTSKLIVGTVVEIER